MADEDIQIQITDEDECSINIEDTDSFDINFSDGTPPTRLNDLIDATISSPTNEQILVYNSTNSMWENKDPSVIEDVTWEDITGNQSDINISGFTDDMGIGSHILNTSNPHSVTKTQVGLGNVDNTSDANKPISTLTQAALNLLVPYTGATGNVDLGTNSINLGDITLVKPNSTSIKFKTTDGNNANAGNIDFLEYDVGQYSPTKEFGQNAVYGARLSYSGNTNLFKIQTGNQTTIKDAISIARNTADVTMVGTLTASNLSGTNTGDQDLSGYQVTSEKNQNNGYCGLDSGGKVPIANLPTTLLQYQGVWDASTNTPTLTNPDLTKIGYVYNISVAGTQFGIDFSLGDWLIYNASGVPEKSDNSDDVTSVNSQTGAVVLDADDIDDTSTTNKFVTATDITNLSNLSGTNTGDQDLSPYWKRDGTSTATGNWDLGAYNLSVNDLNIGSVTLSDNSGTLEVKDNLNILGEWFDAVNAYFSGSVGIIENLDVNGGISANNLNITGDIFANNFAGSSSGTNTGDQDLSGYFTLDQTTPQTITATDTTITASDEIYYGDATDSFKIKKDTVQGIIDLAAEKPFAQQGRLSLPQLAPGSYLMEEVPGWAFSGQTNSIQAKSAWLVPIYVSRGVSYRGFRYNIYSTTGKTANAYRLGIYDVDYSTGLPKNLVWDSSKQTFETTTGAKQVLGLNITLTEGWYYIVGTKNGNINLYGSSPAQQRPPIGGFGDPITKQTLASTTADWTDGFPNPWVNTGFDHLNTDGYEAAFFKLYRNSEA